jgi:hypothetical protein
MTTRIERDPIYRCRRFSSETIELFLAQPFAPSRWESSATSCSMFGRDAINRSTLPAMSSRLCRWACSGTSSPIAAFALRKIRADEIDNERAPGATEDAGDGKSVAPGALLKDRPLLIFLVCAVMSHFANAAMLPLLGEMLAKGHGRSSIMFMSACVVTTQFVITLIAAWSGRKAGSWGRKPRLLIAFGVLPIRAVLYTLTSNTVTLVAIQVLDGVGAGIFGVVSVLVIAALTQGSGRFNITLGAIATAVGIGASLSQTIAGAVVHHFSFDAGFLFLAAIAAMAFCILYFVMPETRDKSLLNEHL